MKLLRKATSGARFHGSELRADHALWGDSASFDRAPYEGYTRFHIHRMALTSQEYVLSDSRRLSPAQG